MGAPIHSMPDENATAVKFEKSDDFEKAISDHKKEVVVTVEPEDEDVPNKQGQSDSVKQTVKLTLFQKFTNFFK